MGKMTRTPTKIRAAMEQAIEDMAKMSANVGYFESARYPDGTSIAYIAAIQEYGAASQGIPPRATMRPTMDQQGPRWKKIFGQGMTRVMRGQIFAREVFDAVGLAAAGDVRKAISEFSDPPLKKATLQARQRRARGGKSYRYLSVKPLVDTGAMLAHLSNVTESK
jgi:hypothetical protein